MPAYPCPARPEAGAPGAKGQRRRRRWLLAALAPLLLAACANQAPGVSVAQPESNVNFGLPSPSLAPAIGSATGFRPVLPGQSVGTSGPLPGPTFAVSPQPGFTFPQTGGGGAASACPLPPDGSSPALAAAEQATNPPAPGYYLWRYDISTTVPLPGGKTLTAVAQYLHDWQVVDVSSVTTTQVPATPATPASTETSYSFGLDVPETFNPSGSVASYVEYTFDVVNNSPVAQPVNAEGETGSVLLGANDGISIAAEDIYSNGTLQSSFTPTTPVTLLPLPVVPGAQFASSGTDPTTGQTLSVEGTITGTTREFGCGIEVAGWAVSLTEVAGGAPQTVNYVFAPQYGGLIIFAKAGNYSQIVGLITPSQRPVYGVGS